MTEVCCQANFVLGMAQLVNPSYTVERWHACLVCYFCLILAACVNIWGRFLPDKLGRVMFCSNMLAFVIVIVVILAMDDHKQSGEFFQNNSGFSTAYASLLGILQAAFGMTGYDATAHMCEELHDARDTAPGYNMVYLGWSYNRLHLPHCSHVLYRKPGGRSDVARIIDPYLPICDWLGRRCSRADDTDYDHCTCQLVVSHGAEFPSRIPFCARSRTAVL